MVVVAMELAALLLALLLGTAAATVPAPTACVAGPSIGCLHENGGKGFQGRCPIAGGPCGRCLPYFVGAKWNAHTSRENCACLCHRQGFALAGVENGANCYCAKSPANYNASSALPSLCSGPVPASSCATKCDANSSETCGGPSLVDIFTYTCPDSCVIPPPSPPGPPAPPAPAPPPAPRPAPLLPPAYYRPQFHYTPSYRYGDGPGDTSGAVYSEKTKTYHIFPLTDKGMEHASSTDLVHWKDHGPKHNLDDSGGVVIYNGTALSLSAGGLNAVFSIATDSALLDWSPMKTLFSARAWNNRKGAMAFPGDPLAPWVDPRDLEGRWWIGLAIDGCLNNTNRNASDGYACSKGGADSSRRDCQFDDTPLFIPIGTPN